MCLTQMSMEGNSEDRPRRGVEWLDYWKLHSSGRTEDDLDLDLELEDKASKRTSSKILVEDTPCNTPELGREGETV